MVVGGALDWETNRHHHIYTFGEFKACSVGVGVLVEAVSTCFICVSTTNITREINSPKGQNLFDGFDLTKYLPRYHHYGECGESWCSSPTGHPSRTLLVPIYNLFLPRVPLRIKPTRRHDELRAVTTHGARLVDTGVCHVVVFAFGVTPSADALLRT